MPKRIDSHKELMDGLLEAVNLNRENPSRYSSEGYLKPLCAPDEQKPFRNSTRCEICSLVVRGNGANLPLRRASTKQYTAVIIGESFANVTVCDSYCKHWGNYAQRNRSI